MKLRINFFMCVFILLAVPAIAADLERFETKNISYYSQAALAEADDYQKSCCILDVSAPKDAEKLPVLVWFHGGGLSGGNKEIPRLLRDDKIVLIGVGYRLSPKAKFPEFIEDAAAAVAWTFANIEKFGGDPRRIYVGGNSAGGYLTGMVGLDAKWLKPHGIELKQLAGLVILTGQVTTHFHVREMLKYDRPKDVPVIDENAPMYHISKDSPPMILVLGDRKIEWPGRVEENELMAASLRTMKHPKFEFHENPGYDHGGMGNSKEAFSQIRKFILGN